MPLSRKNPPRQPTSIAPHLLAIRLRRQGNVSLMPRNVAMTTRRDDVPMLDTPIAPRHHMLRRALEMHAILYPQPMPLREHLRPPPPHRRIAVMATMLLATRRHLPEPPELMVVGHAANASGAHPLAHDVDVAHRPHLDAPGGRPGQLRCDPHRFVDVVGFDQVEAAEQFL